MRSARLNGNVDMHSVLLSFWHWFEGKAEEKIAQKKEPNESRNNEKTKKKKVQQICRKRTEHTFWNMLIYTYLYACVSHTIAMKRMTKNEKFILLLLGVCVILFWFFFSSSCCWTIKSPPFTSHCLPSYTRNV